MAGIHHRLETDLRGIGMILLRMCELSDQAMRRATRALTTSDVALAERVIDGDQAIAALHLELENRLVRVIARQSPVAGDLRALLCALRVGADLERMGGLAQHVAKQVRRRYPRCVAPGESYDIVVAMGRVAAQSTALTSTLLAQRDVRLVRKIIGVDDEMDRLHRALLAALVSPNWSYGIDSVVDLTLISRFYERYGDHTVTIAHQVHFIETGTTPEPWQPSVLRPMATQVPI